MGLPTLKNHKTTLAACYAGYVCQAIVNNFAPLLYVTFGTAFGISAMQLTLLITVNFAIQLVVDLVCTKLVDRIGVRTAAVVAHILIGTGLILLAALPGAMDPYAGIMTAMCVCAAGGGIVEVIVSPLAESCPTRHKSAAMNILHSFYCWGSVAVIGLSTLFFSLRGTGDWRLMAYIWSALPFANAVFFLFVPVFDTVADGKPSKVRSLLGSGAFWLLVGMMFLSGASELAVAQWASSFVETGLGVDKTLGDLLGPCMFAVCMGSVRLFGAKIGSRVPLPVVILASGLVCVASYLMVSLSSVPAVALAGCALTGAAVALMWPGTFSIAAELIPKGGTAMFALLALAGDLGCVLGPSSVGWVSEAAGGSLLDGITAAVVFPALLSVLAVVCILVLKRSRRAAPLPAPDRL